MQLLIEVSEDCLSGEKAGRKDWKCVLFLGLGNCARDNSDMGFPDIPSQTVLSESTHLPWGLQQKQKHRGRCWLCSRLALCSLPRWLSLDVFKLRYCLSAGLGLILELRISWGARAVPLFHEEAECRAFKMTFRDTDCVSCVDASACCLSKGLQML